MAHERHGVSNLRQLVHFTKKLRTTSLLSEESIGHQWIPSQTVSKTESVPIS